MAVANDGRLREEGILREQVERMLADPRSETLATNFAMQWLRLTGIEEAHPEGTLFPNFTKNLARSMRREVELLFDTIVRAGSKRIGLAHGRLHPRRRRARHPLRHPEHSGDRVSSCNARRPGSVRVAGQGCRPDRHLPVEPDVPGGARKVRSGSPGRLASPAASPGRATVQGERQQRGGADGPGSDDRASTKPGRATPATRSWIRSA